MTASLVRLQVEAMNRARSRSLARIIVWVWWVSWFVIFGGFLWIGAAECRIQIAPRAPEAYISTALLVLIAVSWVVFDITDNRVKDRNPVAVRLLITMGSILTVLTIWAIAFFLALAPKLQQPSNVSKLDSSSYTFSIASTASGVLVDVRSFDFPLALFGQCHSHPSDSDQGNSDCEQKCSIFTCSTNV